MTGSVVVEDEAQLKQEQQRDSYEAQGSRAVKLNEQKVSNF
jgi:hypothetical protein